MPEKFSALYDELRVLAGRYFAGTPAGHTLQPTALVNEAYLKLAGGEHDLGDERHFFAVAATAMRQILVDHARRRYADKRGGWRHRVTVDSSHALLDTAQGPVDLLLLDELLDALAEVDAQQAKIVELRIFVGQTVPEVAATLGVGVRTVERHWRFARVWLQHRLAAGAATDSSPG